MFAKASLVGPCGFPCVPLCHAGAELGSRVRGGAKGGARFPGPTKLTTGGGVQFEIFPENIYMDKLFQLAGAKLPLFPSLIVKLTYLHYGL